jgi:hypothetical protein
MKGKEGAKTGRYERQPTELMRVDLQFDFTCAHYGLQCMHVLRLPRHAHPCKGGELDETLDWPVLISVSEVKSRLKR